MSTSTLANTAQVLLDSMTPKFAVSYLRVSTRGQAERGGGHDEGFSIPAQREANKKKAMSMGAIVGKEFVDRGASAKSADRPQLQAMLEYVKENADRVDYVIVHKVDRLARNRDDDSDIMRVLCECGVQLVSASESIDNTPSGMLLHGIMSSIAEFYSQNLAAEVKKGMGEKVKSGGTVGRAPLGYTNVRRVDEKGREDRTVEIDPERAPLVQLAFEEYATGKWSIVGLSEHLAALGLSTRSTPKIPSKPISRSATEKMLKNPYYAGVIRYDGVEYDGAHEPLISMELFNRVQTIMESHYNGERSREHPHFLKGLLYCKKCHSRMIINYSKSHTGVSYPYYVCAGRHRHGKEHVDCDMKAILIDEVEYQIEQFYDTISLSLEDRTATEQFMVTFIQSEQEKFKSELDGLRREKDKLEHKQEKLLEAHLNDAIPLNLLKKEQKSLSKQLVAIEHEIRLRAATFDDAYTNLTLVLNMLQDCGKMYRSAPDHIKRLLNQAIFNRVWIDEDGRTDPELSSVCGEIVDTSKRIQKSASASADADSEKKLFQPGSKFFEQGWNNDTMVEHRGVEPLTSTLRTLRATNCANAPSKLFESRTDTL